MIYLGLAPQTFICAQIISNPKGSTASLTCFDKYRSIAISSVIGKILDHVVIDRQSECPKTCDYQFVLFDVLKNVCPRIVNLL